MNRSQQRALLRLEEPDLTFGGRQTQFSQGSVLSGAAVSVRKAVGGWKHTGRTRKCLHRRLQCGKAVEIERNEREKASQS